MLTGERSGQKRWPGEEARAGTGLLGAGTLPFRSHSSLSPSQRRAQGYVLAQEQPSRPLPQSRPSCRERPRPVSFFCYVTSPPHKPCVRPGQLDLPRGCIRVAGCAVRAGCVTNESWAPGSRCLSSKAFVTPEGRGHVCFGQLSVGVSCAGAVCPPEAGSGTVPSFPGLSRWSFVGHGPPRTPHSFGFPSQRWPPRLSCSLLLLYRLRCVSHLCVAHAGPRLGSES